MNEYDDLNMYTSIPALCQSWVLLVDGSQSRDIEEHIQLICSPAEALMQTCFMNQGAFSHSSTLGMTFCHAQQKMKS